MRQLCLSSGPLYMQTGVMLQIAGHHMQKERCAKLGPALPLTKYVRSANTLRVQRGRCSGGHTLPGVRNHSVGWPTGRGLALLSIMLASRHPKMAIAPKQVAELCCSTC